MELWLKGVKRVATSSNDAECSKAVRAENTAITDPDDDATTSSSMVSKTKKERQIHYLANYVKQELVTRLQKTRFALQMDESTDVADLAILLVIVRYPYESSFEEDMLMCSPLPTTGEEIFNKINIYF
ncbi:Zinc finger BED domain-containing protein 5 [Eumeta japonica]|uniref:Zinc finger BED domain-containing protein 5 n=1 Tax=Eumeta variegata TaxID=151549 RepID=A0A4C1ZNJ2_EUMVA|nr:Zinc finger BED domain-containing protein 5 [Eumeta japonica]